MRVGSNFLVWRFAADGSGWIRKGVLLAAALLCSCSVRPGQTPAPPIIPVQAALPGGSNLLSYSASGQNGYIAEFDIARDTIEQQLRAMYANGQRRLRIPILFFQGGNDGINLDSTGGRLNAFHAKNLADLLALIKAIGFEEIEVGFFPQWKNDPQRWVNPGAFNSPTYGTCVSTISSAGTVIDSSQGEWYSENWNLIAHTMPIIQASGIPAFSDLLNEGVSPEYVDYDRRLWADNAATFGTTSTVGFSIVPTPGNLKLIPQIYGGTLPPRMDLHIYDGGDYGYGPNFYNTFVGASADLSKVGFNGPVVVGEALDNDAPTALQLNQGIRSTGRRVLWLTQWPVMRGSAAGTTQNTIPIEWSKYALAGL